MNKEERERTEVVYYFWYSQKHWKHMQKIEAEAEYGQTLNTMPYTTALCDANSGFLSRLFQRFPDYCYVGSALLDNIRIDIPIEKFGMQFSSQDPSEEIRIQEDESEFGIPVFEEEQIYELRRLFRL